MRKSVGNCRRCQCVERPRSRSTRIDAHNIMNSFFFPSLCAISLSSAAPSFGVGIRVYPCHGIILQLKSILCRCAVTGRYVTLDRGSAATARERGENEMFWIASLVSCLVRGQQLRFLFFVNTNTYECVYVGGRLRDIYDRYGFSEIDDGRCE
jgi:hypothetical protein